MAKRESSDKDFELSFKYSAVGMALVSTAGKYLRVNSAMSDIIGYSEEELLNLDFQTITYKEDLETDLEFVRQLLAGEIKTYQMEKRYYHKKGHIIWILLTVALMRDTKGEPLYFISQIQDITERVKVTEELTHTKERYDRAVQAASIGLWEWYIDTDEIFWSPEIKKMAGMEPQEKLPQLSKLSSMVHPEDREYRKEIFRKHLEEDEPFDFEYRLKHKKGHYIWIHSKGQVIRDDKGKPIYMSGSVDEVTMRKKAELLLKESEERFNLVVQGSRDGIWDWPDISKDKQYWSTKWKELLGYKEEEIEGSAAKFFSFVHPEDRERISGFQAKDITHNSFFDFEYRLKTSSGQYKWFHGRGIVTIKNGIKRMTGSLSDISFRRDADEKLKETNKELERINEDLNSFAYIASHDLKEPIRGIYSNVLFLEQDFEGQLLPEVARRLGRIAYLCERMEKLADDLLNYAKLKNQDLVIKRIDLNIIIQDIQKTIEKGADGDKVEILLPRNLPKVICDEVTVTELFRNLINNGIKYNDHEKKLIEIGYEEIVDKDKIPKYAFYVKDNGVGISKKDQKHIFHVFKRLDNTDKLVQGSGMGLSFVQRIVERHNGRIWVDSALGKGSIFHFTLN